MPPRLRRHALRDTRHRILAWGKQQPPQPENLLMAQGRADLPLTQFVTFSEGMVTSSSCQTLLAVVWQALLCAGYSTQTWGAAPSPHPLASHAAAHAVSHAAVLPRGPGLTSVHTTF